MKDSTVIRNLRREVKFLTHESASLREERGAAMRDRDSWRGRATKAEQEAAEWKRRFDLLLEKCGLPKVEP